MAGDQAATLLAPPRFFRASSAGAGPASNSTTTTTTAPVTEAADAEPTLFGEFQRRKSAFLAHFNRSDEGLATSGATTMAAGGPASASATSENPADWKCNVCNAPLRLLRLRVRSLSLACMDERPL